MSGEPGPRWGCHRLDNQWATRLVEHAGVGAGDLVLDVGAGWGAITRPLLARGARVVAIELHAGRAAYLRQSISSPRLVVARADAGDLRLPRRPYRVVANPPFAITSALLRRLLAQGSRLERADLIVPRHVAVRWASGRGPGAGRWALLFELHVGDRVPRTAFRPAAPMDVAVLRITRRRA